MKRLLVYMCLKKTTYRETGTRDPSETLVGPYKNQETRTWDPSGTLAGPHKNQKNWDLGP